VPSPAGELALVNRPDPPLISAEAILRSRSGRSLSSPEEPVTAENVERFGPTEATVAEARRRLEELGFVVPHSGVTLTVVGDAARFERVFGVKLVLEEDERTGGLAVSADGEPVVPDSLADVVEAVVFPEPPEFFP
jgi:hypothetical protein